MKGLRKWAILSYRDLTKQDPTTIKEVLRRSKFAFREKWPSNRSDTSNWETLDRVKDSLWNQMTQKEQREFNDISDFRNFLDAEEVVRGMSVADAL